MVTPVRNPLIPVGQPAAARPDVTAAQRAFFNAAMGRTGVPAAPPAAAAPTVSAAAEPRPARGLDLTQPPQRILPPGSLINIRV